MAYLMRVELPDVPGSLGRLATAIGECGGNIDAIEIVARDKSGVAVDDVFVATDSGVMPDSIVSACTALDGVRVLWISHYAAGGNLFLDLEAVESMTEEPAVAVERMVDALPDVFRVDWAAHVRRDGDTMTVVRGTTAAPETLPAGLGWPGDHVADECLPVPASWSEVVVAGTALSSTEAVLVGRRGGPEFLGSEIARLMHLAALARSISGAVTSSS